MQAVQTPASGASFTAQAVQTLASGASFAAQAVQTPASGAWFAAQAEYKIPIMGLGGYHRVSKNTISPISYRVLKKVSEIDQI